MMSSPNEDDRREGVAAPKTYDDPGLLSFLFMGWAKSWVDYVPGQLIRPPGLCHMPKADEILYWQPILSKHISDGLIRLEKAEADSVMSDPKAKKTKPYRSILLRATILTFWRRILLTLSAMIAMTLTTLGTIILLKHLLKILSQKDQKLGTIISLVMAIVGLEILNTFLDQHANLYNMRLQNLMEATMSIALFQHGLCHRRDYSNLLHRQGVWWGCTGTLHSCSPTSDMCGSNALLCAARRYQNGELQPNMYTFLFVDVFQIISLMDATVMLVRFVSNLTMGMVLINAQNEVDVMRPILTIFGFTIIMVVVEAVNGTNIMHSLQSKDDRIAKSSDIIGSLKLLEMMGIEDVGYNVIKNSRNDELAVLRTRMGLFTINRSLMRVIGTVVFLVIIDNFMSKIKAVEAGSKFDVSAPITLLHIVGTVVGSFDHLLKSLKVVVEGLASLRRVETFLKACSPNYYLEGSRNTADTPSEPMVSVLPIDEGVDKDTVVFFKEASFRWIRNRGDALSGRGSGPNVFSNVNFQLKRGDVRVVTGTQGCGKTSFIKSILGEMSLVSGRMVVAPLSTGMPIFYTSQEVWLPGSDIRSIITFGYRYDEDIYRLVVAAVELDTDIISWADGDSRVVSEKGYSLSGGQRVRLSLARAIYAYLVFSKANESLEENRCCFLMCLDEPFNGLDPTVTKSILNNLFNRETGLLVRDDIAVLIAMSHMSMEICAHAEILDPLTDIYVHHINENRLSKQAHFGKPSHSSSGRDGESGNSATSSSRGCVAYSAFAYFSKNRLMEFENNGTVEQERILSTKGKNEVFASIDNVEKQNAKCATRHAYFTYIKSMGCWYTGALVITLTTAIALEKIFGVLVANWSDMVRSIERSGEDSVMKTKAILTRHEEAARNMGILALCFVICVFGGMFIAVLATIRASRRIHKFIMNSIFLKTSTDLTLKDSLAKIITFLSSDVYYVDEQVGRFCVASFFAFLSICVQYITICYTVPIISPVPVAITILLYCFVVKNYLLTSKKLQWAMLESTNSIYAVYGDVISGSDIYRSFRRESLCLKKVCLNSEDFYGIKFLKIAITSWAMMTCKLGTSITVLCVSFIPVIYSYARGEELKVAQIGLAISYSLGINTILNSFIYSFSSLEKQMCSMVRFEEYFLQNKASMKDSFDTMVETVLSDKFSNDESLRDARKHRRELVKRRHADFRKFMFRRYRSVWSTCLYRPKIEILDISEYLPTEHATLELKNVSVTMAATSDTAGPSNILRGVTASANAGNIIGIVGRTGAGKSTLLGVLQNIVPEREGAVLLDGRDLNSIPRRMLRHVIGVLPQLPFIFKGWTLRRFLDPRMLYSDAEIMNAIECCGLQDVVKGVPDGRYLDTVLISENVTVKRGYYFLIPLIRLENGNEAHTIKTTAGDPKAEPQSSDQTFFSTSQLRLLTFARLVLYRKSYRVLLIDEPPSDNCADKDDSELFETSESAPADVGLPIYDLVKLYFSHCTTFIVAHDKNALKSCSSVWVMQKGMLVNECSVSEFLASGPPSAK
ncbi:ABC transporter family protein [Babesia caballi]|uniref:ABC transporter family protein n=1 Tax=Babesia caballi TaxID=5871 RepID=A0AAV4LLG1_BABCB|nr:ABC transporter family protein [Babesia caballi]